MKLFLIMQIYSVSLCMATIFKILTPDGTRFVRSTGGVPNDCILGSLYKMRIRESDKLQTVLAVYEQEINQDRSRPSFQKLQTMVKRHIDQKIRTRNFQARNERIETRVLVKTQRREECQCRKEIRRTLSVESKRTVFKRRCLQLPPRRQ